MSLKEILKNILEIKKNNHFQISQKNSKCQMPISKVEIDYQLSKEQIKDGIKKIFCLKNFKLIKYEKYSEYIFLYLMCHNGHDVIRKIMFNNKYYYLINLKN